MQLAPFSKRWTTASNAMQRRTNGTVPQSPEAVSGRPLIYLYRIRHKTLVFLFFVTWMHIIQSCVMNINICCLLIADTKPKHPITGCRFMRSVPSPAVFFVSFYYGVSEELRYQVAAMHTQDTFVQEAGVGDWLTLGYKFHDPGRRHAFTSLSGTHTEFQQVGHACHTQAAIVSGVRIL